MAVGFSYTEKGSEIFLSVFSANWFVEIYNGKSNIVASDESECFTGAPARGRN